MYITLTTHKVSSGNTSCFDLSGCYPSRFQRLQAELSESNIIVATGNSTVPAALLLAVFYSFWHQRHSLYPLTKTVIGFCIV
jgi:hypothetical protein